MTEVSVAAVERTVAKWPDYALPGALTIPVQQSSGERRGSPGVRHVRPSRPRTAISGMPRRPHDDKRRQNGPWLRLTKLRWAVRAGQARDNAG